MLNRRAAPIYYDETNAPGHSVTARDASSEIEYKIPIINLLTINDVFGFENIMSSDLSSLLASSKALTSHLKRQDLPNVSLSLDQIEAQSRRLLPRQTGAQADAGRA